ncbi:MAG: efflux RND transporter periplasmic adaptor subunit [Magnetococcales bacterium]|nr:efflux RND transporter periplasmic adaptor subunit [Magnetococcales bacterium]
MPINQSKLGFEQAGVISQLPMEGQKFAKGQVIARINDEALKVKLVKARAVLAKARSSLEQTSHERAKQSRLLEQKVVSEMGVKEANFAVVQAKAMVDQAVSDVQAAEEAIHDCELIAPFPGIVVSVKANLGEYIQVGAEVLQLADLSSLELVIDLPPQEAAKQQEGRTAKIFTDDTQVGTAYLRTVLPLVDGVSGLQRTFWTVLPDGRTTVSGRYVTLHIENE